MKITLDYVVRRENVDIEEKKWCVWLKNGEIQFKFLICIVAVLLLGSVAICTAEMKWTKAQLVIDGICIAVTLSLLFLYIMRNIRMEIFCFICIIFLGGMSALVQPILNIPDEAAHFARAERVSEGKMFVDPAVQKFETIRSVIEMEESLSIPITKSELKNKDINYETEYVDHVAASNLSFLYFPQAIGIIIAKVLKMNAIWMLWLARLSNLLVYAFLIAIGLKITPRLKYLLFAISISPMSIQQAASCSVDAMINGITILYIAFFLYLYNKKYINKKETLMFYILSILVVLAKVTNICIAGLILLLPLEMNEKKKKSYFIKGIGVFGICVIAIVYYLHTLDFATNLSQVDYITQMNVNGEEQIKYIMNNFSHWFRMFIAAMINQVYISVVQLSTFGWLSYGYPILIVAMPFIYGKICFQEQGMDFSKFEKFLITLMVLGSYGLTCLALYIGWTSVGSESIEGVQGRYFIPILVLMGLVLASGKSEEKRKQHMVDVMLVLLMVASMIIVTSNHYYA